MAITHNDLSLRNNRAADIRSRPALSLIVMSVLCGLAGFIFCLAGEASRSEVTSMSLTVQNSQRRRCYYSGSGMAPLGFAAVASLLFAVAYILEYAYMRAVPRPSSPAIYAGAWITVICFVIAEFLLPIAMCLESCHLYDWTKPRLRCPKIRPGLFATAGVFGLATVFHSVALYITAHRTETTPRGEHGPQPASSAACAIPIATRAYQSRASGETSV